MRIGYARVSTREQNTDGQLDALRAAGCERVYVDRPRASWAAAAVGSPREQLRCDDALVVTKLDRMGRSVRHSSTWLASSTGAVSAGGVGQGIDTTSPGGQLLFHVLVAMAEFVGDLISETPRRAWPPPAPGSAPGPRW